jgi:hypothetical protein
LFEYGLYRYRADRSLFFAEDCLMMLRRLVLLSAALAVIPACGNSPTAPALDAGALLAEEAAAAPVTLTPTGTTTTTTTTTSTTTGGESDSPKDSEGRGGGFLGSGS